MIHLLIILLTYIISLLPATYLYGRYGNLTFEWYKMDIICWPVFLLGKIFLLSTIWFLSYSTKHLIMVEISNIKTDREKRIWLRQKLTPLPERPDTESCIRADGRSICDICGLEYRLHPTDPELSYSYEPFLYVRCDGVRLKL